MKTVQRILIAAVLAVPPGLSAQMLTDDFDDGALDLSAWAIWVPYSTSAVTEESGVLRLTNTGTITAVPEFGPCTASFRFRFTNSSWDFVDLVLRSDGALGGAFGRPQNGIAVAIRPTSNPDAQEIALLDLGSGTVLRQVSTPFPILVNQDYQVTVADDGTTVTVAIDDHLMVTHEAASDYGNRVHLLNGNKPGFTCATEVDWISLIGMGQPNRALALDGIDDFVGVPDSPELRLTNGSYSVTCRYFLKSFTPDDYASALVTKRLGANQGGYFFAIDGLIHPSTPRLVTFSLSGAGTPTSQSSEPTTTGEWHHMGIVYDENAGSLTMYIDGIVDSVETGWPSPAPRDVMLYIGRDSAASRYYFHGLIDDVCLWDAALTSNAITTLSGASASSGAEEDLIACWNFNDATAADATGHGHDGVFMNGAATVAVGPGSSTYPEVILHAEESLAYAVGSETGILYQLEGRDSPFNENWYEMGRPVVGNGGELYLYESGPGPEFIPSRRIKATRTSDAGSLLFDGSDDMAFAAPAASLDLVGGMTIEAWVYPVQPGGGTLVTKALSETITCYSLIQDMEGHAAYRLFAEGGSSLADVRSTYPLPTGTWSHVAATYDGTQARLYVNGAPQANVHAVGRLQTHPGAPVQLGSIYGTNPFRGMLDDVRVWETARSAVEIQNAKDQELDPPSTGLAAYWQMKEPDVQEIEDASGRGHVLTLGALTGPDGGDPTWSEASFVSQPWYRTITSFGLPCFGMSWISSQGVTYQVQARDGQAAGEWADDGPPLPGGGVLRYFDPPTRALRELRVSAQFPEDWAGGMIGLVAHYAFDGDANDTSGHEHHASVSGAVPTADRYGGPAAAYAFDGASYIVVPQHPELEFGTNDFSVACWFSSASRKPHGLISYGDRDHGAGWTLSVRDDSRTHVVMIVDDGPRATTVSAVPGYDLYDGAFHHVAATVARDGNCTVYIDGMSVAAESVTRLGSLETDVHDDLQIGRYWWSQEYNPIYHLVGSLDDVMLLDRALTPAEVQQLAGP